MSYPTSGIKVKFDEEPTNKSKDKTPYKGLSGWLDSMPKEERTGFARSTFAPLNNLLKNAAKKDDLPKPDAILKKQYMLNASDKIVLDPDQKYALVYDEHGNRKGIIEGKLAGLIECKLKKVNDKNSAVYAKDGYLKGIITGPGSDLSKYSLDPLKVMPPVEKIEKIE
jgi:hypothetical protein